MGIGSGLQGLYESLAGLFRTRGGKLKFNAEIRDLRWVVFDTETTGLHPYSGDEVMALGAVVVEGKEILVGQSMDRLIDPGRPISKIATEITGITQDDVQGKPALIEVLPQFINFIEGSVLAGHCVDFDLAFLNIKLRRQKLKKIYNPAVDTAQLARVLFPHLPNYSLDFLAGKFGIRINNRHSALGDAVATAELLVKLLDELDQRQIHSWRGLLNYLHWRPDF